jgi:predicted dehydrogenase
MKQKIRWGILGCGAIAKVFAQGLAALDDAELVAAGSRDINRAEGFARQIPFSPQPGTYQQTVENPDVDVIYVATHAAHHMETTMLALDHGKAVLCEKPFAINASQARKMVDKARQNNLLLMEAMWTRFLPAIVYLREKLNENFIGAVRQLIADFQVNLLDQPDNRNWRADIGGGALLDLGVYPISLASYIFGSQPEKIETMASLKNVHGNPIDQHSSFIFGYPDDRFATLSCGLVASSPSEALILGEKGSVKVHGHICAPQKLTVTLKNREPETLEFPFKKPPNGYKYEAMHIHELINQDKTESLIMPLDETVDIMSTMDAIRKKWSFRFPME